MWRSYAVVGVLCVLFLIRALGGNDNTNTTVDDEFDPDDWYATDPDRRGVEILAWIAGCFTVFWFVVGSIWVYTHPPPPPPPPVDATATATATARVDELEPSPGIPNQFIGFASSGEMGSEWGDLTVKSELAVLRAELERLERENQRLRDLLNQAFTARFLQ